MKRQADEQGIRRLGREGLENESVASQHRTGKSTGTGTDKGRWQRGRSHVEDTADCSLSCWGRGSEQPCAGHESQCGWTKHQGSRQTRVSIQESNKSGKLGEQLDGSMKYRQAEHQGDCHTQEL